MNSGRCRLVCIGQCDCTLTINGVLSCQSYLSPFASSQQAPLLQLRKRVHRAAPQIRQDYRAPEDPTLRRYPPPPTAVMRVAASD